MSWQWSITSIDFSNGDNHILIMLYQILTVSNTKLLNPYPTHFKKSCIAVSDTWISNMGTSYPKKSNHVAIPKHWKWQILQQPNLLMPKKLLQLQIPTQKVPIGPLVDPTVLKSANRNLDIWYLLCHFERGTRWRRLKGVTHNILNRLKNSKGSWRFRTFPRSLHNKRNITPSPCDVSRRMKIKNLIHKW